MVTTSENAESRLRGFIAKFTPTNAALIRAVRRGLRTKFPSANELVYDNYNFFVIGYGPTERPSDCFVSIAAAANGVGLCFLQGAKLGDPNGLLLGSGKQTRFLRLSHAKDLTRPQVVELLEAAASLGKARLPAVGRGRLIIRSVSKKQRARRK